MIVGYVWQILAGGTFLALPPPSVSGPEKARPESG